MSQAPVDGYNQAPHTMQPTVSQPSNELIQAEKDLQSLKNLKKETQPCNVFCPSCSERGLTRVET